MSGILVRRGLRPALLLLSCSPSLAEAHIKWFANVDVSGDPTPPWQAMGSASFALLAVVALFVLGLAGALDARLARIAAARPAFARWHAVDPGAATFAAMRVGVAGCFIASVLFFGDAPVLLTPELKTNAPWAMLLPWTVALAALFERPRIAAAGIGALFLVAVADYGAFHLLDYPLFVGIAAVLWFADADAGRRARAMVALRIAVALTFLWGGVEKWLYPQWTYPLLCGSGKAMLMGLAPDVFMQGAGFVEFALAFVVLVGGFAARVAGVLLVGVFLAAIPMFGAIDAVGHAPFMLSLLVLAAQANPLAARFAHPRVHLHAARWGAAFAALLGGVPLSYYAAHQFAYGRPWPRLEPIPAGAATCLLVVVASAAFVARGNSAQRDGASFGAAARPG